VRLEGITRNQHNRAATFPTFPANHAPLLPVTSAGSHAALFRFTAAGCGLVFGFLFGCGTEATPPADRTRKAIGAGRPAATAPVQADGPFQVTVDSSGRKWLTPEIPYDAFPDVPSDEEAAEAGAGDGIPVSAGGPDAAATIVASTDHAADEPSPAEGPEPSAAAPASASESPAAGWNAILPVESLQREIATVRNDLSEKLLTVGSYNESFEAVANDGWLMSALATVAQEHSAPISWKGNSLLARDAAVSVASAATARGRQNFNDAQLASEQLTAVLDNNAPDLPKPDPSASREETADRAALMARMQAASDRLKAAGTDESAFKKDLDAAGHEARVLAALAKFTSHGDYTSADEPEYQSAAAELVAAGGAMAEAVAAEDRAGFTAALDRVGTACNKCHEKFRFGN